MPTTVNVSFHRLTREQFTNLSSKTDGCLYFITDENVFLMRKGTSDIEYGGRVKFVPALPTGNDIKTDWLYIVGNVGSIYNSSTSSWDQVFPGIQLSNTLNTADTAKAVSGSAVATYVTTTLNLNTATVEGGTSNESGLIPKLDGNGKIHSSLLPSIALSEFKGTVHNKTGASDSLQALLGATGVDNGDWVILDMASDPNHENGTYIYFDDEDTSNSDTPRWIPMGSMTTEAIQALINAKLAAPSSSGTSGQVLSSNGDGTTSWTTMQALSWTDSTVST